MKVVLSHQHHLISSLNVAKRYTLAVFYWSQSRKQTATNVALICYSFYKDTQARPNKQALYWQRKQTYSSRKTSISARTSNWKWSHKVDTLNFLSQQFADQLIHFQGHNDQQTEVWRPLVCKINFFAPCDHNPAYMPILITKRIIRSAWRHMNKCCNSDTNKQNYNFICWFGIWKLSDITENLMKVNTK
jgi:hypothetical protein